MRKISVAFLLLGGCLGAKSQTFTMGAGKALGDDGDHKRLFNEPATPSTKTKSSQGALILNQPETSIAYGQSPVAPEASATPVAAIAVVAVAVLAMGTGAWTIRKRALR